MAIPVASAAEVMRVTFIRHGESEGNASGLIDTSTPGPVLTPLGQQQSQDVVDTLGDNNYDAIYASTMVRTQLTAAPMSQYLGLPIQVLPGLREIEAGAFEGTPEAEAQAGYGAVLLAWAFGGQLDVPMPGTDPLLNGHVFDARVEDALKTMYDNGDRNAVAFSHGGTIMFWTMMNVNNLTLPEKIQLLSTAQLHNTDYVVIEGNPEDGWTLVNWNGQQFTPEPTFGHEVKLQVRTLSRQLEAVASEVKAAFATGNPATIATAINRGVAEASFSVTKFSRAINAEVIDRVSNSIPSDTTELKEQVSTGVENLKAAVDNTVSAVTPEAEPAVATDAADESTKMVTKSKRSGATDLTDGNKSRPGAKAISRTGERVREAVEDAREQMSSSAQKIGEAVKKATGQGDKADATEKDAADTNDTGEKDAA
ncbi:histidine phosphatase family protein [Mycolicibacterium sp. XJ870]